MVDQDSNPQCWAMPSLPVLLQPSVVDCDTVLPDSDAIPVVDQPVVETSTERPPSAARQTPPAFMPTVETSTETTECTVSGDSRMTKNIKTTKQVTAERVRSRSREKLITTTRTVKTITTVEKTTEEIENIDATGP